MLVSNSSETDRAVAVYCGSSKGTEAAYAAAATSLGNALAQSQRRLVYGGGRKGIMGIVSETVVKAGGKVTGVMPYAMYIAGGEKDKINNETSAVQETKDFQGQIETIIVESMHERKIQMASRVGGFVALPGGYGTFEEILEVTTWTQLSIHSKPVVILNVLGFYEPLKDLIKTAVKGGFIQERNADFVAFVNGPPNFAEHDSFDWGAAALKSLDEWQHKDLKGLSYDWTKRKDNGDGNAGKSVDPLEAA